MKAADRVQAACRQQSQVLQIAPTPALIAQHVVDQCAGCFLKAAGNTGQEPHPPTGAAQQGRLDEVMAQDQVIASQQSAQMRQARGRGKGPRPNDGIVPPVVAFVARPVRQPLGQQPAIRDV